MVGPAGREALQRTCRSATLARRTSQGRLRRGGVVAPRLGTVLRAAGVPLVLTASQVGRLPLASAPLALLLYARLSSSLAVAGFVVAVYTAGMAVSAPVLA